MLIKVSGGLPRNRTEQSLRDIDGRAFDVLKYQVTAFTDRDWEFLRLDWEQNDAYLDDEAGKVRHAEERHSENAVTTPNFGSIFPARLGNSHLFSVSFASVQAPIL